MLRSSTNRTKWVNQKRCILVRFAPAAAPSVPNRTRGVGSTVRVGVADNSDHSKVANDPFRMINVCLASQATT